MCMCSNVHVAMYVCSGMCSDVCIGMGCSNLYIVVTFVAMCSDVCVVCVCICRSE